MTGSFIPEAPAPDQQTLEGDRNGHLHILDQGSDEDGMANRCMSERDDGAGDWVSRGGHAEKDEEKKEKSHKELSNTRSNSPSVRSCNSTAVHVSLTTRFIIIL